VSENFTTTQTGTPVASDEHSLTAAMTSSDSLGVEAGGLTGDV
jgi:hypothetical protein